MSDISNSEQRLRLVQFNVENLFLFLDLYQGQDLSKVTQSEWQKFSSSTTPNKPLAKVWQLARVIEDMAPDILMLNEVGGVESLENFNQHFLSSRYAAYLKEGNSHRGIDVGYLVRRDLEDKVILLSHRDRPLHFLYPHETQTAAGGKSHYFSRDVAELRLFRPGENSPRLVILLSHLKSKLDPDGIDPEGKLRRRAETRTLIELYNEVRRELPATVPVVVSGDFNGIASKNNTEPEFVQLHEQTDLAEALDILGVPHEERFTQVQINPLGQQTFLQLDYIFVSPALAGRVASASVHYFKNELGHRAQWPRSLEERGQLPSDHYPVVVDLKLS